MSYTICMNKTPTVFTMMKNVLSGGPAAGQYKLFVLLIAVLLAAVFLVLFLRTRLGLAIRATGSNADMVRSSSINPTFTTTVGLCVSNSLTALSGCWHEVYTGVALLTPAKTFQAYDRTRVHFAQLRQAEMEAYIRSGEPFDKAGAYAIQGRAGMFVDRIEGSFSNVIGLPQALVRDLLIQAENNL